MLKLSVQYNTKPSQNVFVSGIESWDVDQAYHLFYREGIWHGEVPVADQAEIEFKFFVRGDDFLLWESGENRKIDLSEIVIGNDFIVEYNATWRGDDLAEVQYLDRELFKEIIYKHENELVVYGLAEDKVNIVFQLASGIVASGSVVHVVGGIDVLGNWDSENSLKLCYDNGFFKGQISVYRESLPFEYKYVIINPKTTHVYWEEHDNRVCNVDQPEDVYVTIYRDDVMGHGNLFRGAGLAVPVFSLRSEEGLGVGEFNDLIHLADICSSIGFSIIQLLPIYDTNTTGTWVDSYPYSAISVYALHPQYLHLPDLTTDQVILDDIRTISDELNALEKIDYERVMAAKNDFIDILYDKHFEEVKETPEYQAFLNENLHWLTPYSVFCILRDTFNEVDFRLWPEEFRHLNSEELQETAQNYSAEINKIYYVQYYLDKQLTAASHYCASKGLGLKGDLPIGVNLRSADAWLYPNLFNLSMSTGAPPDQFSADGQNWGFPTYNWEEMAKDGYKWWKDRLSQMGKYFHAFRIDHILGFFRIWEVPRTFSSGMMGHFYPSIPVHRDEISPGFWDIERLTDPYITYDMLQYHFGGNAEFVKVQFFDQRGDRFVLKHFVKNEEDAANFFEIYEQWENQPSGDHLIRVFKELRTNVCFLPNPANEYWEFFPRINMNHTTSFQRLDGQSQHFLQKLYLDYFYSRQESKWYDIGMTRLPVIKNASNMLVCGEDLGMVPDCVYPVMDRLSILGLRVQRMPPDPKQEFGFPHEYDYLTVCTPSSHDTSTLREWWEEDLGATQLYWNTVLGKEGPAPRFANESIIGDIIEQHLSSPAMWAIFPIQEFFGIFSDLRVKFPSSERINIPAIPKHYWRYRMHVTLEALEQHPYFVDSIKAMLERHNRKN